MLNSKIYSFVTALLAVAFLSTPSISSAQIVIDNTMTPDQLVQNVLLGSGVVATNVTYNGMPGNTITEQAGSFDGVNSNIGLDAGLILATGDVNVAVGPNDDSGLDAGGGNFGQSDVDLDLIIGGAGANDAAVLEFDFVPTGDSLKFRYVFSSEEYLEFVNAGFNDAFGFFLSGPGITGTFSSPIAFPGGSVNLALIPGTTTPVTIDNVNTGVNPSFYIDNGDGFSAPQNTDVTVVQYDGFTVVLEATALVQCGQTYHIKLAIADAGDTSLDSGVFLEENSFSSNGIEINVTTITGDSTLVEGCFDATFTFHRPDTAGNLWINYDLNGNAIEGVDFANIPDSILIPSGLDSALMVISPFADGIPEGVDTLTITVFTVNSCGDTITNSATIYIADTLQIITNAPDLTLLCASDSITISATASGAVAPYYYDWNSGQTTGSFNVATPIVPTQYIVVVTDSCQNYSTIDTVNVIPNFSPAPSISVSPDVSICPGGSATLMATTSNGAAPLFISWSNFDLGTSTTVSPTTTTTYTATVTDACGNTDSQDVTVTVLTANPLSVSAPADVLLCAHDSAALIASASGGMGNLTYLWTGIPTPTSATSALAYGNPSLAGVYTYTITVTDECGNVASDDITVTFEDCTVTPPNVFSPNKDGLNDFFVVQNIEKFENSNLQIMNRWGKKVYETDNYQNDWDGDNLSDGTYFFIITLGEGLENVTGHVTLLRQSY